MTRMLILLALSKFVFFVTSILAQPIWLAHDRGTSMAVEFLKPYFVDSNSSTTTAMLFISGRLPLSQTITIVGDIPFAHHGYKDDFGLDRLEASTVIGNPYLGVEIQKQDLPFFVELGLRLPLGADLESRAANVAQITDSERFEAFIDYDLSAKARLNYHSNFASSVILHLRGGWSGGHSVAQEGGPGNYSTLDYGIRLGYQMEQVSVIGGLTGHYLLDGGTPHLSRFNSKAGRTVHQIAVAASVGFATVRPGLHFKLPVDDFWNDEIRFVLGLNLGYRFK